ncbi:MAG: methane monooxygenase/ammonia monooxygenase subunit C [Nitrospira sp.]|nr:methane monooxygenase/ammonia monooxygenase subunit C [Nitrospira sp.]
MASTRTAGKQGYDISQWYDSRPAKIGWLAMLGIITFWLLYQRAYGYSHGLDSMTPEFDSVWMGLWRFNILANATFFAVAIGWIWITRDRNLANLDPKLELKRYFYWLGWLACYVFGVYFAGSLTLEQDAAWHQVIIRDTSFTASHIVAFYGTFPLYITCGVASYLYAQTRLPLYAQATSFPLVAAVVGPMFILPNVGLNEWGHAFWFVDEMFAAPLHWGFVALGWCGLFGAAGGVAAQTVSRMSNLADVIWNAASKSILDPFSSQIATSSERSGY